MAGVEGMVWCDIHFQWEIWLSGKLVATLHGGADDTEKSLALREVIDVILDPKLGFGEGISHQ